MFLNGFMENYPLTETFLVSENQSSKLLRSMFASLRDFETHYDQQVPCILIPPFHPIILL